MQCEIYISLYNSYFTTNIDSKLVHPSTTKQVLPIFKRIKIIPSSKFPDALIEKKDHNNENF